MPPIRRIDLTRALSKRDFERPVQRLVLRRLERDDLLGSGFLYRGFDGEKLVFMKSFGTDRVEMTPNGKLKVSEDITCARDSALQNPDVHAWDNPLRYALGNERKALVVYNAYHLDMLDEVNYKFKDPKKKLEAMLAVYLLEESLS
ncbi:hypothetical protein JW826_06440 [Candidatus Woesearchaeota archaeon]|nr:hypothetical protein [Candidatus Woesearchaeota archaeon]